MRSASPIGLGIAITVAYLVCHWVFDGVFDLVWGFPEPEQPVWRNDLWWADVVNAALIGFVPAALRIARIGIERDLDLLRPRLRCSSQEFAAIRKEITGSGGWRWRLASFSGVPIGIATAYLVTPTI